MFIVDEKEKEYRYGDNGPKYLMQEPRSSFGICQLKPGQVYAPHEHRIMEENFFVIKGRIIVEIDGVATTVEEGQMFHVEPGEFHKVSNPTEDYVRYIITCAPFAENDKYTEKQ